MTDINTNSEEHNVDQEAKYWMVRTMGGRYYKNFSDDGYIALGYNEIDLKSINALPRDLKVSKLALDTIVKDRLDSSDEKEERNIGYISSMILKFCMEMKKGDYVIIPSYSSKLINIGIIAGETYEYTGPAITGAKQCDFKKRRPIQWLKVMPKSSMHPAIQLMMTSRHPITDIGDYARYIDSTLKDFYIKNNESNLILRIDTKEEIKMTDFFGLYKLLELSEKICAENGFDDKANDVSIKVLMESPGVVHLIAKTAKILFAAGLLTVCLTGGGLNIDSIGLDLSTKGLIESISNYMDRKEDRAIKESIKQSLDSLQIRTPQDLETSIKLLNTINKTRNSY
jgi:Uncharacterized conserved protein